MHPQAHWTGLCTSSDQVLDRYRALVAAGTEADVHSVEVDRDAVALGLAVGGTAEGAGPAPRQQLYQVFTVEDSQIIDIRGYPDRSPGTSRACRSSRAGKSVRGVRAQRIEILRLATPVPLWPDPGLQAQSVAELSDRYQVEAWCPGVAPKGVIADVMAQGAPPEDAAIDLRAGCLGEPCDARTHSDSAR